MKPQDIVTDRKLSERLFDAYKKIGKVKELEKVAFGRWVECDAYDHVTGVSSTEYEYFELSLGMGTIFFLEHKEYKVKKCFPALEFTGLWSLLPSRIEYKGSFYVLCVRYVHNELYTMEIDYLNIDNDSWTKTAFNFVGGIMGEFGSPNPVAEILIYLAEKEMV